MREIKFRIYDKELKESHIEELQDLCEDDIWYDGETEVWSVLKDCNNKQKRFVALQFTGLVDKNNYEIYEGDIVKSYYYIDTPDGEQERYNQKEIKFDDVLCEYNINAFENLEIIGNIYDNPELLEI